MGRTLILSLLAASFTANAAQDHRVLTIDDGIVSTRAMVNLENDSVFLSPDKSKYAVMLVSGDLVRDGVWAEILVGRIAPGMQAQPRSIAKLFSRGLGPSTGFASYGSTTLTNPQENVPVWLDESRIAMLWEDGDGVVQLVSIDVKSGEKAYLTNSPTDVTAFTVHPNGQVVYDALSRHSRVKSEEMLRGGFAVRSPQALPLLAGYADGVSMFDFMNCDRYLLDQSRSRTVKIEKASPFHYGFGSLIQYDSLSKTGVFSPNGSRLILNTLVNQVPKSWLAYEDASLRRSIEAHAQDPTGLAAKLVQQLVIVDTKTGAARQLWDAPVDASNLIAFSWSPDSSSVLVWPTFLPASLSESARSTRRAVAEIEIETGRYRVVPIEQSILGEIKAVHFETRDRLQVSLSDDKSLNFQRTKVGWSHVSGKSVSSSSHRMKDVDRPVRVVIRQDMNSPPNLVVDSGDGNSVTLLKLNPEFDEILLGRVAVIKWVDEAGRDWKGRLYYPVNYDSSKRYPIVIQTRCLAEESFFSLYGCGPYYPTTGPGWSSFIAQSLAGEDIGVLQVSGPEIGISGTEMTYEWEAQTVLESGLRAAAEHLIEVGIARRDRIGVMGFSLTGWVVEYILAHTDFPFAAAIASDHGNMGYMQAALNGWPAGPSNAAGGEPFGEGLDLWLKNAPVFNAERIQTPLQLQLTSSGENLTSILWHWELFSRLRHLKKAVEYYVIPDVRHGSHTLQNPRQLRALQSRALDWWCFWLKDEEHYSSEKHEQYAAWRELRALKGSSQTVQ